jgi:peptidoglycan hydrolase-like protein with peptidoglycan-binding domain
MKRGFFSTLRTGDTGSSVSELQSILGRLGYAVPQTGLFEESTSAAVVAFQTQVGIKEDGAVGYQTWSALDDAVARLLPGGGSVSTTVPLPKPATAGMFKSITNTQLYIYGGLAAISGLGIYFYMKSRGRIIGGMRPADNRMTNYRQDRYLK